MNTFWLVIKGVLTGAVGPGISVMYATYGEVITERSGKINLGVEGAMLMGACFGFIAGCRDRERSRWGAGRGIGGAAA